MPEVFGVVKDITLLGYTMRTIIVSLIMFLVGRFIAKRAMSQLTTYDFVFTWILGALTVAPLLDGKISFTYTLIPIITLFFWHNLLSIASRLNRKISYFFHGKPVILISQGQIIKKSLKRHFINADLLLAELRVKEIFNISDVAYAILEPNGHISVMKNKHVQPITSKDMNLTPLPSSLPTILIKEGKLLKNNLAKSNLNENWLKENLSHHGLKNYQQVYLATVDNNKNLYVSKTRYNYV